MSAMIEYEFDDFPYYNNDGSLCPRSGTVQASRGAIPGCTDWIVENLHIEGIGRLMPAGRAMAEAWLRASRHGRNIKMLVFKKVR